MDKGKRQASRHRPMFWNYPNVLTPAQVQEMLGVGRRMVHKLLHSGNIQNVRIGKLYRVPKVAAIDYLCRSEKT